MKKYQIIYSDPPWKYNDKMGNDSAFMSATSSYQTQDLEWIKSLKVNEIADDNCVLFMWAVSPLLPEAFEVIKSWGFKYKTIAFCWNKLNKNGSFVSNMGRWTMGNIEVCLLATKGIPKRITKNIKQQISSLRVGHSVKPIEVRERIVELMGDLPRIELFTRPNPQLKLDGTNTFDGWDYIGNEIDGQDIGKTIENMIK